jgi:F-type H+-transporting ATPase subunit epsilon
MAEGFKFELVSPARLVLSEEASQVVVPGSDGDFTMLKGHAPFMTTVRPGVVEVTATGGRVARVFVRGGLADASPNGLTILAEQAIPVDELRSEQIAQEIRDAEEDVADARTDEARRIAQEKLDQLRAVFAAAAGPAAH